ncbi:MAG: hypothetical protein MUF87_09250 [Anaerolineae bacterium]|jgi:hypothetical protein|nr:hypothetical protein [Anaerolineae bacterium]
MGNGGLSPQERAQIRDLLRFLGAVLICVLAASIFAAVLVTVFQNG